jgi:hypothetical protein
MNAVWNILPHYMLLQLLLPCTVTVATHNAMVSTHFQLWSSEAIGLSWSNAKYLADGDVFKAAGLMPTVTQAIPNGPFPTDHPRSKHGVLDHRKKMQRMKTLRRCAHDIYPR